MMRFVILVLSGACLLQPFYSAAGQPPFASEAQKALETEVSGKGLTLLQPIKINRIIKDYHYTEFTFDVPADIDLVLQAAGDSTCGDIDLSVFDAAGAPLGYDKGGSATPHLALAAGHHSAKINVTAELDAFADETNDTCSIAIGVYGR